MGRPVNPAQFWQLSYACVINMWPQMGGEGIKGKIKEKRKREEKRLVIGGKRGERERQNNKSSFLPSSRPSRRSSSIFLPLNPQVLSLSLDPFSFHSIHPQIFEFWNLNTTMQFSFFFWIEERLSFCDLWIGRFSLGSAPHFLFIIVSGFIIAKSLAGFYVFGKPN